MCLLTYCPAGETPREDALVNGTYFNDDGHGFAIALPGRLMVRRFLDAAQAIEAFMAARAEHPAGPALFHSRMATHGATVKANVHPFTVGGDSRTVVAHNGVFPKSMQPGKGDHRSDTRVFADTMLRDSMRRIDRERTRKHLERWMTPYNKALILTVNPRYRQQVYLLNEDSGTWETDGCWYSNDGYLPYTPPKPFLSAHRWPPMGDSDDGRDGWATTGDGYFYRPGTMTEGVAATNDTGWPDRPVVTVSALGRPLRARCGHCDAYDAVSNITGCCLFCDACSGCGEQTVALCTCPAEDDGRVPTVDTRRYTVATREQADDSDALRAALAEMNLDPETRAALADMTDRELLDALMAHAGMTTEESHADA